MRGIFRVTMRLGNRTLCATESAAAANFKQHAAITYRNLLNEFHSYNQI